MSSPYLRDVRNDLERGGESSVVTINPAIHRVIAVHGPILMALVEAAFAAGDDEVRAAMQTALADAEAGLDQWQRAALGAAS